MKKAVATTPKMTLGTAIMMAALGITGATSAAAEEATSFSEIFTKGDIKFNFRYRYEYVDEDVTGKDVAKASTLKSRVTLTSASFNGLSALLEVDDVSQIGSESYATPSNGKASQYPIVADPDGTTINQAYLQYKNDAFTGSAGRQRILHAGQRFVGGVGWRQNEQTYDSFRVQAPIGKVNVDYSYIWDVDRIFGPDTGGKQARRFESDSHALYASFSPAEGHKIGVYTYLLDFDNAAALSSQTYGVEYSGKFGPITVAAAAASQTDYGDNPTDYDAEYYMAELGTSIKGVGLGVGYEMLGSDDGEKGFATPLATLHKFQGWADIFLATPDGGIEDLYFKVTGKVGGVALAAFYHDFEADEKALDGIEDYGEEFDAVATYPINKNLSVQLKYANYNADEKAVDTEKVWFSVMLNF
ncbi:MAG: hypothetical protein EP323_03410 [Gammaproteobacteria bacterium]|nr:MAG: hypothetical protein EP323_03410 [Gammaproteobacteria bacterium]